MLTPRPEPSSKYPRMSLGKKARVTTTSSMRVGSDGAVLQYRVPRASAGLCGSSGVSHHLPLLP